MTKATVVRRLTKMLGPSQRGKQHGRTGGGYVVLGDYEE